MKTFDVTCNNMTGDYCAGDYIMLCEEVAIKAGIRMGSKLILRKTKAAGFSLATLNVYDDTITVKNLLVEPEYMYKEAFDYLLDTFGSRFYFKVIPPAKLGGENDK